MAFSPGARAASTALIMLGVVVGASTAASGCTEDAGTTPQSVCGPGQATCQVNLTLLHTSDIHSRLFDYDLLIDQTDAELGLGTENDVKTVGGIARVSYVINRERARSDRVLHLDSGDIWQGAPVFNYFHGEPEVRAESQIFPDAMVIGNHEYDDGALNVATQFMKWANFPVLGANYIPYSVTNPASTRMAALLKPFEVFTQQGLRIAVIGMGNLSTLGSLFNQPNGLGMTSLNTTNVAQAYVDLLRPYVDFVIILSHLGLDADQEMVEGTTGIDIVLGGHNHIVINPPQQLHDCTVDPANPGYIWAVDPNIPYNPDAPPPAYNCSNDPTCKSSNCADPGGAACKTPSTWYPTRRRPPTTAPRTPRATTWTARKTAPTRRHGSSCRSGQPPVRVRAALQAAQGHHRALRCVREVRRSRRPHPLERPGRGVAHGRPRRLRSEQRLRDPVERSTRSSPSTRRSPKTP